MDVDRWIEQVRRCSCLDEASMRQLCDAVIECLVEEPNVVYVSPPVTVCGDIHGQFYDLMHLFEVSGPLPDVSYIFLGDYVDRGRHSLESLTLLLLYKLKWPDRVVLLRGNHETRQITQTYGFYDECILKYGNAVVWKYCCQVFDYLAIAALIDGRILCLHGGLSPDIATIDQIRTIRRAQDIPASGPYCDLVWSDPEDLESSQWSLSPRGAGYLFGHRVASEFCQLNDLTMLVRAHQLVHEGYKFMFPERNLVTVWSAPNYCYRCGNVASVLRVDESLQITDRSFVVFEDVPQPMDPDAPNVRSMANMFFD